MYTGSHFYHKGTTTTTTLRLFEGGGLGAVVLVRAQVQLLCSGLHKRTSLRGRQTRVWFFERTRIFFLLVTTQNIKYSRVQDPPETSVTYCQQNKTISLHCCARTKWPLAMRQTSHSPPHTGGMGLPAFSEHSAKTLSWNQKWWALC